MACFLVPPVHQNRFLSLRQISPAALTGFEPEINNQLGSTASRSKDDR